MVLLLLGDQSALMSCEMAIKTKGLSDMLQDSHLAQGNEERIRFTNTVYLSLRRRASEWETGGRSQQRGGRRPGERW